mmetsp:Transcript_7956/g.12034  ORF Transcript_7956/g.12034 Transcript_7956/m.12034 type:complete len:145 (-) Transcript_7956:24-458(-)|eukprot:CAMPEP_0201522816 /NCGR_PEP_ID=MMETSP0161_2-20130828/18573_1 /ASSEMBLY_ACC=CAM_ASM_000251 /TAXON_ID=180227 /ORGANISM="Neoparamoeba aestuarina, Strain SoJaBio B1-5/56/2" /LENGTH=144 /DNA_ID=CAMNT_0047921757 /DNA_START=27 /DNA_END=461 /DNA_ORIENTATION=-
MAPSTKRRVSTPRKAPSPKSVVKQSNVDSTRKTSEDVQARKSASKTVAKKAPSKRPSKAPGKKAHQSKRSKVPESLIEKEPETEAIVAIIYKVIETLQENGWDADPQDVAKNVAKTLGLWKKDELLSVSKGNTGKNSKEKVKRK